MTGPLMDGAPLGEVTGKECSTCATSFETCRRKVMDLQGPCCVPCGSGLTHEQKRATPSRLDVLAVAVGNAAGMLDAEEHRYVERFTPCPNGCVYEYADAVSVKGQPAPWPSSVPTVLVQTAGPDSCEVCDQGTVEDEGAEHISPLIEQLYAAKAALHELAARGIRLEEE